MARKEIKIGMKPPHLEGFTRPEVIDDVGLSYERGRRDSGEAACHAVRLAERKILRSRLKWCCV